LVTRILDTLIENAVNHSKIVATEIIDDILKGAVKTDNNSTKWKHSVTDKTFVTWKEKFPWPFQNIINDFCCNNFTMIYSIFNQRI
jgi:hypothetical protein